VLVPFQASLYARRELSPNVKTYVRTNATLLDVLTSNQVISRQMCESGKRYAEDHARVWGSGGARDSCIPPIGGEAFETAPQAAIVTRARERMNRILNLAGPGPYVLVRRVCAFEQALGADRNGNVKRYNDLRVGLMACATVYGVPEYDA
jgi:hypothetical protein